jgi:hypothetical protein
MRYTVPRSFSSDVWTLLLILAQLLAFSSGCAKSDLPGPSGEVLGTATYQNKPIPEGSAIVLVHNETGLIGTAITNGSGSFQVRMRQRPQVLIGEYTVHVRPPGEPDPNIMEFKLDNVPPAWKLVPKRYWMSHTSRESFIVKEGRNTYNLVLRD